MKHMILNKWWVVITSVLLITIFSFGLGYTQSDTGTIIINVCNDQNADGSCSADEVPLPDVHVCLDLEGNCLTAPAIFDGLSPGTYAPFLRFVDASEGYYPTASDTSINLSAGQKIELNLGAVYPVHPKGVAVHTGLNKVYVAFQGPNINNTKPYPFVAVINGDTDEVIQTIPGGSTGIGRSPWGVAVSDDNVYVSSFEDGQISIIDANTDTVIKNVKPNRSDFQPTTGVVNPITGWVHFPDYRGGRVVILDNTEIIAEPRIDIAPFSFSPFEMVVANAGSEGHNFVTMRDAIQPEPFKLTSLAGIGGELSHPNFRLPNGETGVPHAIGLWQNPGISEPRLFVTYADDPRPTNESFPNPNKLAVYKFSTNNPKELLQLNANIVVGDYAEVGLVYNTAAGHMVGTYAGFAYIDAEGDAAACNNPTRGGTYAVDSEGNLLTGDAPGVWRFPTTVVGNPPLAASNLQWRNPFEIAVNPNNNKVYVTDRCWNDFPTGGQLGGGAVLIIEDTSAEPGTPTPTPVTPATPEPTTEPTAEPTIEPTPPTTNTLAFDGPTEVNVGNKVNIAAQALNVTSPGLYGVELEINFDPTLISVDNLQVNPDLSFVLVSNVNNTTGKIRYIASRQGQVPGLTGNVNLFTFDATAVGAGGNVNSFTYENIKIGDPTAQPLDIITLDHPLSIVDSFTPEPTGTPDTTSTPATGTPGTPPLRLTGTPSTGTPTTTGTPTPSPSPPPSSDLAIRVFPTSILLNQGETRTPEVQLVIFDEESPGVKAVIYELTYNPMLVQVEDADPDTSGVQIGIGAFFKEKDPESTIVINTVENGIIEFFAVRASTASGVEGIRTLSHITWRGLSPGDSDLILTKVDLFDEQFQAIPVITQTAVAHVIASNTFAPPIIGTPTPEGTSQPNLINLTFDGPTSVMPDEVFTVAVQAQDVNVSGLYSSQFEIYYDPDMISTSSLQLNSNFELPIIHKIDNDNGRITIVASRQGNLPGLTGDVTLLTFEARALGSSGQVSFAFDNPKIGDETANLFKVATQDYIVSIGNTPTPTPTNTPTPVSSPTPNAIATAEAEATATSIAATTTAIAATATAEANLTATPSPTSTSKSPTVSVSGQVILMGRASNDWSGATLTIDDSSQTATTDASGQFEIDNVTSGEHTSISADAPGYLPAICTAPVFVAPATTLTSVTLLSGDINDDGVVDITDGTAIGISFGQIGLELPADINRDGIVDIFDIILVSINFGQDAQNWDCLNQ